MKTTQIKDLVGGVTVRTNRWGKGGPPDGVVRRKIFEYVLDREKATGFTPSYREIGKAVGRSLSVVHYHLRKLKSEGKVVIRNGVVSSHSEVVYRINLAIETLESASANSEIARTALGHLQEAHSIAVAMRGQGASKSRVNLLFQKAEHLESLSGVYLDSSDVGRWLLEFLQGETAPEWIPASCYKGGRT